MHNFTIDDVVTEIKKLAQERPDFNYLTQPMEDSTLRTLRTSNCSYISASRNVQDGEGCIVGQALTRLGVSRNELVSFEGQPASTVLRRLVPDYDIKDVSKVVWINDVQERQDNGADWGLCVDPVFGA